MVYVPVTPSGTFTSALTIQVPDGKSVPLAREIVFAPAVAVTTAEVPHVVDAFGVGATTILPGAIGK